MGLKDFEDKITGDEEIKKSFKGSLSLLAKQDMEGKLMEKRINIEQAENGVILRISMEAEFGKGDKRDWKYINKSYIFPDMKEVLPILEKEMKFSRGEKIMLSEFLKAKKGAKVHAVAKRTLNFVTGDGDGHVHMGHGTIVDKKVGDKIVKVFEGETMENAVYWKLGQQEKEKPETDFTKTVNATLHAHKHSFSIPLTKGDESGWRIYGQTTKAEEHDHPVDFLDFWSTPVTNSPDQK